MSRVVPRDKPLSEDDRAYLHARGEHSLVAQIDEANPPSDDEDVEEKPDWASMTVPQLDAEIDRINKEYNANLSKDGKKDDKVARLEEWWAADDETAPPAV